MSTYTPDSAPATMTRITRPVVPDGAKMLLTPLDLGLETIAPYLSSADRRAVQEQFGTHLGRPAHLVLVSNTFIDWACRAGFPALPLSAARQRLAYLSVAQYQRSILGRVMFASLRIMGLERALRQAPRQFAATTNYGTRWVAVLGPRHWRFDCEDELMHPETMIGNLHAVAEIVGTQNLAVTFSRRAPRHYSYDITWSGA